MTILIIVIIFITLAVVYYFPLQRILDEIKYEQYAALQGVSYIDVASKNFQKDYKQGGYFISVTYKSDPKHRYLYHYFLLDYRKSKTSYNTMYCYIFDMNNSQLDEFADATYKPLK